jgi:hypothetical protein
LTGFVRGSSAAISRSHARDGVCRAAGGVVRSAPKAHASNTMSIRSFGCSWCCSRVHIIP